MPVSCEQVAFLGEHIDIIGQGESDDVGLQAIKACGGIAVVQDPADAEAPDMPASALHYTQVDHVCRAQEIAPTLVGLVSRSRAADPARAELADWIAVENRMLNEGSIMEELDKIGTQVPLTCPECGGAGFFGDGPFVESCACCHGTGVLIDDRVIESEAKRKPVARERRKEPRRARTSDGGSVPF